MVHPVAKVGAVGVQNSNVVPDAHLGALIDEARVAPHRALRQHRVEQHGVHSADREVAVGVHVILVADGDDPVLGCSLAQELVGERGTKRGHSTAAQIRQGTVAERVGLADRQHLAKCVVRHGDGEPRASTRQVFEPAHADVEVAADGGGLEAREPHLDEARRPAQPLGDESRHLDIEADQAGDVVGIGLDERRPTLGVAAPAQLRRLCQGGRCTEHERRHDACERAGPHGDDCTTRTIAPVSAVWTFTRPRFRFR